MSDRRAAARTIRQRALALQRACDAATKAGLQVRITADTDWVTAFGKGREQVVRIDVEVYERL